MIAGYGKIGRAIGAKLDALGVRVEGFSRGNIAGLPKALKDANWFILALPSDTGTDNFLDSKLLAKLPRKCVVVNIGRGNAIDEAALLKALKSGRIAGAYLDVFHNEPGPLAKVGGNSKGILSRLKADLPQNLIRMPHSSAFSGDYLKMCFTLSGASPCTEWKASGLSITSTLLHVPTQPASPIVFINIPLFRF